MGELAGKSKRNKKRRREKRKRQIILIGIIIILIILITTVIKATGKKTKESVASIDKNTVENTNNEILNENLFINEEQNIEQNNTEENLEKGNIIKNENTNNIKKNNGGTKYRLEVNCTQNVVNVYEKDANGEYNNCVKVMLCSIGTATPRSGTYGLKKYDNWEWKGLQGDVYGQYATQITGNILFHSVPYTEKYNNASLEYWEYDKLGTAASLGCVRLTVQNAKWIYNNCASGTKVMFYEDTNPGPLGKPSEKKISSKERYRNWDPTDLSSDNPWINYTKEPIAEEDNGDNNSENLEENIIANEEINNEENNEKVNNVVDNTEND